MTGVVIETGNDYISFQNTLPHFRFILVVIHVVQSLANISAFVFALFPWFCFVSLVLFCFLGFALFPWFCFVSLVLFCFLGFGLFPWFCFVSLVLVCFLGFVLFPWFWFAYQVFVVVFIYYYFFYVRKLKFGPYSILCRFLFISSTCENDFLCLFSSCRWKNTTFLTFVKEIPDIATDHININTVLYIP